MRQPAAHDILLYMIGLFLCASAAFGQADAVRNSREQAAEYAELDKTALAQDLKDFERETERMIKQSHDEARDQAETREEKEIVGRWRDYWLEQIGLALTNEDPRAALLDLWAIASELQKTLDIPEEAKHLGKAHPTVQQATAAIRNRIDELVRQYLPPEDYERASAELEKYVNEGGFSFGDIGSAAKKGLFSVWGLGSKAVGTVANIPLAPARAVTGINRGVNEFENFNEIAARFTAVIEKMPAEIRQELVVLINEVADKQTTISQVLGDAESASDSFTQTLTQANELAPKITQAVEETGTTAERLKTAADSIQGASRETTELINAIKGLMPEKDEAAKSESAAAEGEEKKGFDPREYEQAALAIRAGSSEVTQTLIEVQNLIRLTKKAETTDTLEQQAKEEARPFDVRDYGVAADGVASAASELNKLLVEIRSQSQSGDLENTLAVLQNGITPSIKAGGDEARATIRYLAICLAGVILFTFLLAFAFIMVRRSLAARRPG